MKFGINIFSIAAMVLCTMATLVAVSCSKGEEFAWNESFAPSKGYSRIDNGETRHVMLLYSAGFNNLSYDLSEDIEELCNGDMPGSGRNDNVMLVLTHLKNDGNNLTPAYLVRLYKRLGGEPVRDTVKVFDFKYGCADADAMKEVLTYIKDNYPARDYGMVFSSHGTGWLPPFYTLNSGQSYEFAPQRTSSMQHSIGNEDIKDESGRKVYYEMELCDFAQALPMHFDYILFDACLMGCIEVAYELKDKCDHIGFSQTEIMSQGFDYTTLASHLVTNPSGPDPEAVCREYFASYNNEQARYPHATISYIDCAGLESLAEVCKSIFAAHRSGLASINPNTVQIYYQYNWHWFYDMKDIVEQCGATPAEMEAFDAALTRCVRYVDFTDKFLSIDIRRDCGFSMYLPCDGNSTLDRYYKTLLWNKDTGLVY